MQRCNISLIGENHGDAHERAETGGARERIASHLPSLSPKQRRVADAILANPSRALVSTVGELAERAEVVPATVVRFAQGLGYLGFPEFREALRAEVPSLRSPLDRLDDEVKAAGGSAAAMIDAVRERATANLERTFEQLDRSAVEATVDAFLDARRVLVVGAGTSGIVALHLYRTLQMAQIFAERIEDWYDLMYTPRLGPGDVLFAITVWKYSRVTVQAVERARELGARTVILTDTPISPAAHVADTVLLFSPSAIGEYLSPVAGCAVIDCLAAGLAARTPERVESGMREQYALGHRNNLMVS